MADIKDRKVFVLNNFQGLDKENVPQKVASFRASDGENFIIDSKSLKTRPAFKYHRKPAFDLETDDYIIGWHQYDVVTIYVTTKHIYVEENPIYWYNEVSGNSDFICVGGLKFNFTGLTPLFQEEKNCLFIFCLNQIFVFSVIRNADRFAPNWNGAYWFTLYELQNKPKNPFDISFTPYYQIFEDLPIPYVPTLFIGDKGLDDINLLSNSAKYRIFASSQATQAGSRIIYKLPTNFDVAKHGGYDYEIAFYKDQYPNVSMFPIYMGKQNEDFFDDLTAHGTVYNDGAPIIIQNVFHPVNDFEYLGAPDSYTVISEILGLDKNTFFNFKENITQKPVFDYLMQLIANNGFTTNQVVYFLVPVEYKAIYHDVTTNSITHIVIQQKNIAIYVQLFLIPDNAFALNNEVIATSGKVKATNPPAAYPPLPYLPGTFDHTYPLDPINKIGYTTNDFREFCHQYLKEYNLAHPTELVNGNVIRINGYFNEEVTEGVYGYVNDVEQSQEWHKTAEATVTRDLESSFPGYPNWPAFVAGAYTVFAPGGFVNTSGHIDIYNATLINDIKKVIYNNWDSLPAGPDHAFIKLNIQSYYKEAGTSEYTDIGMRVVIPFYFEKSTQNTYLSIQSMSYSAVIDKFNANKDLYEMTFNQNEHVFELKVQDYFYDYHNEPSIDVKVTFEINPDYQLISKSKFGIAFGSENRLFLAGNSNYPNLDRYNVSNDLLGDNVGNQSYELSYFPSKNYRILGGRGAINGYVVATDSQLYITKASHPNDQKLFVRERILDENGIVGYKEYKTSINETPLNNRCIVRFYNDILILSKNGLFGIELSANVLTDERLIKLRSGFINTDLIMAIAATANQNSIYILENNQYLYIFIGNKVYVADARYIDKNENSTVGNVSYEIVKWDIPIAFVSGQFENDKLIMLDVDRKLFYSFENHNYDDRMTEHLASVSIVETDCPAGENVFMLSSTIDDEIDLHTMASFRFENIYQNVYRKIATVVNNDYTVNASYIEIINEETFYGINDGDHICFKRTDSSSYEQYTISEFELNNRTKFKLDGLVIANVDEEIMYVPVHETEQYIAAAFDYMISAGVYGRVYRLVPYQVPEFITVTKTVGESDEEYIARLVPLLTEASDYYHYVFSTEDMHDCMINYERLIEVSWTSAVLDFGNNFMEKTMFKTHVYGTKNAYGSSLSFGYRAMRRYSLLNISIPLPNNFDFSNVNLENLSLGTFADFGISLPTKENNFLYIQLMVIGYGSIQLNAIEILYKLNRRLKTIN